MSALALAASALLAGCGAATQRQPASAVGYASNVQAMRQTLNITWPVKMHGRRIVFALPGSLNAIDVYAIRRSLHGISAIVAQVAGHQGVTWILTAHGSASGSLHMLYNREAHAFQNSILSDSNVRARQGLSPLGFDPVIMAELWTPIGSSSIAPATVVASHLHATVTYSGDGRRYTVRLDHICSASACAWFPHEVTWSQARQ